MVNRAKSGLRARRARSCAVWLAVVAGGCAPQADRAEPTGAPEAERAAQAGAAEPTAAAPRPGFDVGSVIQRVHFAFRAEGGGFAGGDDAYGVRVGADGAVAVAPVEAEASAVPAGGGEPAPPVEHQGAPLTLATDAVARAQDGVAADGAALRASAVGADGALTLERGAASERLENTREGVEQSWRFDRAPAGRGELTVRVRVAGERYAGSTDAGLHFVDPATGLGVRYGTATWVDARGARTPVPARYEDGAIVLTVPAAAVDGAAYPAVLDPTISPEHGSDNPITAGAAGEQTSSAVAFDGTNFLVVWADTRGGNHEIFGARVSSAGVLLDPGGFDVSNTSQPDLSPAVAFDGSDFLVVWAANARSTQNIYGARVLPAGTVAGAAFAVSTAATTQSTPRVAWNGGNYVVVWSDRRTDTGDIYSRAVTSGGVPTGSDTVVAAYTGAQTAPSIASNGSTFFTVFQDPIGGTTTQIRGQLLTGAGAPSGAVTSVRVLTTFNATAPSIAYGGGYYLAAFADDRNGATDIYAERVTSAGVAVESTGTNIAVSTAANAQGAPAVAYDGTEFAVAWQDARVGGYDVYGARVSTAGVVLDSVTAGVAIASQAGNETLPAIAFGAGKFLVAWQNDANSYTGNDVYAVLTNTALNATITPVKVSVSANDQQTPAVAYDGTNYLLVWSDSRGGATSGRDIVGTRVDATGAALDPSGIVISSGPSEQSAPTVAYNSGQYLVAWQDFRSLSTYDVYARPVSAAGVLGTEVAVSTATSHQEHPSVTPAHGIFMLAWDTFESGATWEVHFSPASPGSSSFSNFGISSGGYNSENPAVACHNDDCVVAYEQTTSANAIDVYAQHLSYTGIFSTWLAIGSPVAVESAPYNQYEPAIACDGTHYLIAYAYANATETDVHARLVTASLAPFGGEINVSSAANPQYLPAVAWDGARYLVAWQDFRNGGSDIYGTSVDTAGSLGYASGFAISSLAVDEHAPAVAAGPTGTFLVGYSRYDAEPLGAERVHSEFVSGL